MNESQILFYADVQPAVFCFVIVFIFIFFQQQNYMVKLGYYEPPKGGAAGLEEESGIKQAIMKMQRFAGISPSGRIRAVGFF